MGGIEVKPDNGMWLLPENVYVTEYTGNCKVQEMQMNLDVQCNKENK